MRVRVRVGARVRVSGQGEGSVSHGVPCSASLAEIALEIEVR